MTVEIKNINTKPESDPYHRDTGGITKTVFWLDPEARECGVEQEYQTNSTSMDRWHNRELTWVIPNHPHEETVREWIEGNLSLLEEICDSYECVWDGNNHKGSYSDGAWQAYDDMERELDSGYLGNDYNWYTVEDWMESSLDQIDPDMSDQELGLLVERFEPSGWDVVSGDILEYITQVRDQKRYDQMVEEELAAEE